MENNERYQQLLQHCEELQKENDRLKVLLQRHGIKYETVASKSLEASPNPLMSQLSLDEKVQLFRSLFRGREDVYARRWQSKTTGKGGYQPVCINEWSQGVCDKKRYKCADCPNRNFEALNDRAVYWHLEGKREDCTDVIGLYAIMPDNNCAFLCADFDDKNCEHGYKEDVTAFVGICRDWDIPYVIERSRSGNGAHVWIFFEDVISAYKARRLGSSILTEAMNQNGRMSFKSYDRIFPNQDSLPEGGLGNLVALPLQGQARRRSNTVFVDDNFLAYRNQWAFLSQVKKMTTEEIDKLLIEHTQEELGLLSTSDERKPWIPPAVQTISSKDIYTKVDITRSDKLYIPIKAVSAKVLNHLKRIAAFKNPEFYRKQAMRLSTYSIPRIISCFEFTDNYLLMPRGCEDAIISFFKANYVDYTLTDKTNHGQMISVTFQGKLHTEQQQAVDSLSQYNNGVLYATTAFGKTVTAAALIADKKVNTLILVHSKALLTQWKERLSEFLEIDYQEPEMPKRRGRRKVFSPVGCLDSTGNMLHGIIDIALIQSCVDGDDVKPFVRNYGMVIVDECHHVSSVTFERVLKGVTAHYVYGLTATPIRKDGHQPIIFMQCGPIRFSADAASQRAQQGFHRYLIPRFTSFRPLTDETQNISSLYQSLVEDEVRNKLIVDDVCKAVDAGRIPMILTSRKAHVEVLSQKLRDKVKNVIQLTGTGTAKEKESALQQLRAMPAEKPLVIVATGKYVGEGFDYPRLDTLFLALPISWRGLLAQYAGRLHREYAGKRDVRIYDYIDLHHPVCDSMYKRRLKGYASIGYTVVNLSSPTLFDSLPDLDLSSSEGQIFNGRTFFSSFCKDLLKAQHSIIISSPKLYRVQQNKLTHLFKDLLANGINIIVLSKPSDEQTNFLKSLGITIKTNKILSHCCAIIDKTIVWYGSVHFLGFSTEEDNIIKLTDTSLATELIGVLMDKINGFLS